MTDARRLESRVVILAPTGRDGGLVESVLRRAGIECRTCDSIEGLIHEAAEGAATLLGGEEAITASTRRALDELLGGQPPWSDLPLLVLTRPGADSTTVLSMLESAGNVTLLERPVRVAALVSAVRVALRARQRQYEVRGRFEAQALLSAIVTTSDDAIVSKDLDGTITTWNGGAERLFGYTAEAAIGRSITMLLPDSDEEVRILEKVRRGERVEQHDSIRIRRDGSPVHVSVTISPIIDARGRVAGASTIARDISQRVRAEEILRDSEARLAAVLEQLPVGVGACDLEGRWTIRNRLMRSYVNDVVPSRDTAHGWRWEAYDAEGNALPRSEWPDARVLEGQPAAKPMEMIFATREGRRMWALVGSEALRNAAGESVGGMVVIQDIDAIKRAEIALRESEERFRSLVSVITDVPWTTNAEGEFHPPQPAWSDYTGQSPEELSGFGWLNAIHPEDRERVHAAWERARHMRGIFETDGRLWHGRSREFRHFIARATPLFHPDGSVREWVGTCTDVHERRRAENALKEADRRKNEFLATLAHELRNPLAPIRNSMALLSLASESHSELHYVGDVLSRQVNHMVRLIDDLTEVSRITLGKIELQREYVDLDAVIQTAAETSQPLLDAGRHALQVDVETHGMFVHADRVRLAQVFSNLLNNAAKYSEDGSPIRLSVRRENGNAVVSVRDQGIGIPTEMLPRVFDMFTQLDSSPRRRHGGLGIGLTLVQNLIELHGGSVAAASEGPGKGSEFVVRLPLAAGPIVERPPAHEVSEPLPALRVLVVDDNRDAAESSGMLLRALGADARVVHGGPAALDAVESFEPDLVLLDLGMPGMDGYEVARRIRSNPSNRDLMLVALTGWGQEEDRIQSKLAGFDHHLVKPAGVDDLRQVMIRVERRARGSEPATGWRAAGS